MPDWTRFHDAILAGRRVGEIPAACEKAWAWLDLAPDARRTQAGDSIRSEASARWMLQALPFVRRRLLREAGIDPDDSARLAALLQAVDAGRAAPAELDAVRRWQAAAAIGQAVAERYPAAALPAAAPDPQQETLIAAVPALTAAIHRLDAGMATPEGIVSLHDAMDDFDAVGRSFAAGAAREHTWWMATAWWAAARAALELGRIDEGRDALEHASAMYAQAGDTPAVDACRQRLRDLASRVAADFDTAAERELRALVVRRDPLGRAQALVRLAREIGHTGDRFEAARVAEQAAEDLCRAGYGDPEPAFDAAADEWIATAAQACRGNDLFGRLCQVAECWGVILGARTSARLKSDPAGSTRAEAALRRIPELTAQWFEQAGQAEDEAARRFALWCPQAAAPQPRPDVDASVTRSEAVAALDDAIQALREACNDGADEAQLATAIALRARAEQLGSRVHVARALIEQAYVLLALRRPGEVAAPARQAVSTLLGEQPARLGAFATGFERELYLTAIDYQARALAAQRDHEALIALCEPVIRDIEGERARVSSPYQQSAFLATRTELYEFVAAAAFRTGRVDLLLTVTELLKARAALRSRLAPDTDVRANEMQAQLRAIDEALRQTAPDGVQRRRLLERRGWLSTALSIARARAAGAAPSISVAAVQQVLAPEEAAISWFWLGTEIAIVLAITREEARTALVEPDAAGRAQHQEYLATLTALAGERPDYDRLIPRIDRLVAALGAVLLPPALRTLVAAKSRLLLSPHRSLHLFPFHAIPWGAPDRTVHLVERFAIRYAPNLGSLLLPWHGNTQGGVLAVGVPEFDDPRLPPLPGAGVEAEAVAAAHGAAGKALIGATRAQFAGQPFADYRCLHLATHGSSVLADADVDDPLQSCLDFRDGALSGLELAALPLRCELVVLAACHSGQRSIAGRGLEQLPGDDLFGLQAALFEAGVAAVLGALWPVEDETALALMVDFHRAYAAGAAPDQALRAAMLAHLGDATRRRDLFYWAPFFVSALGRTG